jgi:membrane associated rhomboid family serine protease
MTIQRQQLSFQRPPPVVLRLIIANALIWFIFSVLINSLESRGARDAYLWLMFDPSAAIFDGRVWQLFTYGFLHDLDGLAHILFNCMALYFLGTPLAQRWGGRSFLKFFLLSVLGAGIVTQLLSFLPFFDNPVVGASGAIFALLTAFSMLFPTAELLIFFVLPVKARNVIWIAIAIDIVLFVALPRYDVAIHTHMGGALTGWLLVTGNWHPARAARRFKAWLDRRRGPPPGSSGRGGPQLRTIQGGRDRYLN